MIHAATGADVVYHKEYDSGMLYSLYYNVSKKTSTVENAINRLDAMLMAKNGTSRTNFTSLTEEGKVKSFAGRDRNQDYLFRHIFSADLPKVDNGRRYQLQSGVDSWNPGLHQSSGADGFDELVLKLKDTAPSVDPIAEESTNLGDEIDALEVDLDQKEVQLEEKNAEITQQVSNVFIFLN